MLSDGKSHASLADAALTGDKFEITEIGTDAGAAIGKTTGILISDDVQDLAKADVLIDFTRPQATLAYLPFCVAHNIGVVIGTTGFDAQSKEKIVEAARSVPVVFAPNMSVGVNSVLKLLEIAGALLSQYDCEIVEMHHKHKVDAPSGTALEMGRRVAQGRGVDFDSVAVLSREGHTGERPDGAIGFAALRGGDVVGDHTVIFAGPGERIEISHKSGSRAGTSMHAQPALSMNTLYSGKYGVTTMTSSPGCVTAAREMASPAAAPAVM